MSVPISPTTKECNSRARKHFGSQKERCYNRLTEAYFSNTKWIFPRKSSPYAAKCGKSASPAKSVNKEDHVVRIIE
jgi:hypothetical protein